MSLFPTLPTFLGTKALAGIAVAGLAGAGGTTAAVMSSRSPSAPAPSTASAQGPAAAGHASEDSHGKAGDVVRCAEAVNVGTCVSTAARHGSQDADAGSAASATSTTNHGSDVRAKVKLCQEARPTTGPQGIGSCVAPVASGQRSVTRGSSDETHPSDSGSAAVPDRAEPEGAATGAAAAAAGAGNAMTHGPAR